MWKDFHICFCYKISQLIKVFLKNTCAFVLNQIPLDLLMDLFVSLALLLRNALCGGTHQRMMAVLPSVTMSWRRGRPLGSLGPWLPPNVKPALTMPPTSSRATSTSSESLLSTSLVLANHWTLIPSLHRCNTVRKSPISNYTD